MKDASMNNLDGREARSSSISDPSHIGIRIRINEAEPVIHLETHLHMAKQQKQNQLEITTRFKRRRNRVVLCEDVYLGALEAIIQRDFFPSIQSTINSSSTAQGVDSMAEKVTPLSAYSKILGGTNIDTNNLMVRRIPLALIPGGASALASLSLEEFFSRYQSDDNASFNALQEREAREHLLPDNVTKRVQQAISDSGTVSYTQSAGLLLENERSMMQEEVGRNIPDHRGAKLARLEEVKRCTFDVALLQNRVQYKRINYSNTGFNERNPPHSVTKTNHHEKFHHVMGPPSPLEPQLPPGALRQNLRPYSYVMTPDVSGAKMTPVSRGEMQSSSCASNHGKRKSRRFPCNPGVSIRRKSKKRSRMNGGAGAGIFSTGSSSSRTGRASTSRTPGLKSLTPAARELALRLGSVTPLSSNIIQRSKQHGRKERRSRRSSTRPCQTQQQQFKILEGKNSACVRHSSSTGGSGSSGGGKMIGFGLTDGLLSHKGRKDNQIKEQRPN